MHRTDATDVPSSLLRRVRSVAAYAPFRNFGPPSAMTRAMRACNLAFASALLVGCASRPSPPAEAPAEYRSVHIDTIAPPMFAQFEGARREWLGELTRAGATDGRGIFLQIGDDRFYTVRSFARFGDFDTRGEAVERSLAAVPKAAGERYDHLADTALVFPHTSEIWRFDAELSYAPASGALTERTAACGRLLLEDAMPDPAAETRYSNATIEINRALGEARYPLTRATFRTVYGAGHLVTLWLARSREELDAAPSVEAAVARVRSPTRAAELTAACDASIVHRTTDSMVVRHDLSQ
jgi:hypothetical protein